MIFPPNDHNLPIDAVLPELKKVLAGHGAAVLQAPPGAGKTTKVPMALLDQPWLAGKSLLMLEPRRLAATNAARYMAQRLGEEVGRTVGYTIRYERRTSRATRIEVVTEGILTLRLQADPELTGIGLVVFDEFHERNLNSDLGLALCLDIQQGLREDLKLLVMSATLDCGPVAELLGGVPIVSSAGRSFPVEVRYLGQDPRTPIPEVAAAATRRALGEAEGDILVFLPGAGEIGRCLEILAKEAEKDNLLLCPLYGELPFVQQERAILPGPGRKVVLATNIAETSLTIEGVRVVVDSGLERRPRFDPARGMTTLETVSISQASAEQRAGRAGRLAPGICYRLWTEGTHRALLPFTPPEIRIADLTPLALELVRWGVADAGSLAWLDPPPAGHLSAARQLLKQLGALSSQGRLTATGKAMAAYPAHPRLARLLVAAREEGRPGLGADLAALLQERDIFISGDAHRRPTSDSDLLDRVEALHGGGGKGAERAARHWRQLLGVSGKELPPDAPTVGRLLALAYPDRIGRERAPGSGRYLLSGGQGARLSPRSSVRRAKWLVAVEVAGRMGGEGEINLASTLTRKDIENLFGSELCWRREVEWDERAGRVVAREVQRLGALALQERSATTTADDLAGALLSTVRRQGLEVLGWTPAASQWRSKVRLLARTFPEGGWPDLSEEALLANLEQWLVPVLGGVRNLTELSKVDPLPALQSLVGWGRQRELERLAPERLEVPSGSRIRLDYQPADGPVLAAKLQELFGLADTPRVAGGRKAVLIHLLSPAGRPLAITRDLHNFWNEVYPEVRKEMKGRYPRHPWPEDPWDAEPTRQTKKGRG